MPARDGGHFLLRKVFAAQEGLNFHHGDTEARRKAKEWLCGSGSEGKDDFTAMKRSMKKLRAGSYLPGVVRVMTYRNYKLRKFTYLIVLDRAELL